MEKTALSQDQMNVLTSQVSPILTGEHIRVQHLRNPPGEGPYHQEGNHTMFMSLAPRPIPYLQTQDGQTHTGLYRKGDLLITPANTPLFVRWEGDENCLQIQLTAQFLKSVARENLQNDCDRLELMPTFQTRDVHLEAIATMLFSELQQNPSGNQLYVDSLANILAVNLLRQHATTKPKLPIYEGGLPQRQLMQILDYIDAHLDQNLKLENLAQLLDMSQFHFSRLFKQSIGLAPHQYLTQQRVERAKQLLKQTDQSIVDIALHCGFNSHSHLSKKFRQITGATPKSYRAG
ncbi:transcriptional regulator containing an amidase domain and an AraC-type DNA-binding HTH domain [Xenococcus sp. PCC 7305]|uniref:helix-turn-helix domain-containing protein n=1 Tax=Xenococcus sp. PCC 7305 TaxID=102125 RepID=UPI0002AC083F|nr:AraC family transcriptional regulator [Xenococcus sp. PCC 7305]ELS03738.1 transcriptional regulator containing an amidase domain and an AraC-type DNA-binding HTH domain [Xenococcus sp. PCC 7305]